MPIDFDSYGLDDEVKAKIKADYDADVSGLKAKNSDLVERVNASKLLAEETALNAAKAEEDAKVALAEKEGNIAQYKAAVQERDDKLAAVTLEFKEKADAREKDLAVSDFIGKRVVSDPAAQTYMEKVFRESISVVDGEVRPVDVTKNLEQLHEGIVSDDAYSKYIKADVGSGSGASGANGTSPAGSGSTDKEQRIAAINQKFGAS